LARRSALARCLASTNATASVSVIVWSLFFRCARTSDGESLNRTTLPCTIAVARMSVVVVVVLVALVQPALIFALELVIQDHTVDMGAALQQTGLCLFVGTIDLDVVLQLALAHEARVEGLLVLVIAVAMALQQAPASLGQNHRVIAVTRHAYGLDQSLLAEMSEVAGPWVGRSVMAVPKVTTGDHSKRTNGCQRTGLRAA